MNGFSSQNQGQTEGGEALSAVPGTPAQGSLSPNGAAGQQPGWYALWTHSHCERLVYDQLSAKGFHAFFPTIEVWSRRSGVRHRVHTPMFPGYLFLRHTMDKMSYIDVRQTRGLVTVLGERWDRLAAVPDVEITAIQTLCQGRLSVRPHTFLREGQRVRIARGPLADVEGILLRQKCNLGLLVLSVGLLQRSVAVEVDCTWVVGI